MQNKTFISTILIFAANMASASGGISVENVERHAAANKRATTSNELS